MPPQKLLLGLRKVQIILMNSRNCGIQRFSCLGCIVVTMCYGGGQVCFWVNECDDGRTRWGYLVRATETEKLLSDLNILLWIGGQEAGGAEQSNLALRNKEGWKLQGSKHPIFADEGPKDLPFSIHGVSLRDTIHSGLILRIKVDEVSLIIGDADTGSTVPDNRKSGVFGHGGSHFGRSLHDDLH